MRRHWICGLTAVLVISGPGFEASAADKKTYTMEDLTIAAQQQSWQEVVDHLQDIAPGQRDAAWQKLLGESAGKLVESAAQRDPRVGFELSTQALERYPTLKSEKPFMEQRGALGLAGAKKCFGEAYYDATHCEEMLRAVLQSDPGNAPLAMQAGKLARANLNAHGAMPFFAAAITKKGDPVCADEDVHLAVVSAFALPKNGNEKRIAQAQKLAGELCAGDAKLQEALKKELADANEYYLANACPLMLKNGMLKGLAKKKCEK